MTETRIVSARIAAAIFFGENATVVFDAHISDFKAFSFQRVQRMQCRVVLDIGRNDVTPAFAQTVRDTFNRVIVAFGRARVEKRFPPLGALSNVATCFARGFPRQTWRFFPNDAAKTGCRNRRANTAASR